MIEATIHFIVSLIQLFVKFLSNIEITLYGYTFSFYSFFLASVIILAVVGIAINSIRTVGSKIGGDYHQSKVKEKRDAEREARRASRRRDNSKKGNPNEN